MEIECEVLEIVAKGMGRPSHIISRANISWSVFDHTLRLLLASDLLFRSREGKRDIYRVTQKGYSVLGVYRSLKSLLSDNESPDFYARGFMNYPVKRRTD